MSCPSCGHSTPPGVKFCPECGHDLKRISTDSAQPTGAPGAEGERRQVTVLFCDLAGYTAMVEKLDPEEVKEIMGRVFGEAARVVTAYGGTVEKYIGDAVMALFGVPAAHEDDPLRAVRAAREIHQAVEAMSPEVEDRIGRTLSTHTGITTGLVVTGGAEMDKGTMGVVGDTVNVAARLSDLASAGEILIGADTQAVVERYFVCEEMPPTKVKGKADPVRVYKLLEPRELPVGTHRFSGLRAKLIGRGVEMAQLERALERLRDGNGSIISVRAEAGTGKSRLIEDFRAGLLEGQYTWVAGNAHEYAQGIPYYPVIDLLNRAWGIDEGNAPAQVREKMEANVGGLLPDDPEAVAYIGSLYSLEYEASANAAPEYRKDRIHEALLALFEAMAAAAPTIFFIEDLHWADSATVELLRNLLTQFTGTAITLATYRPPFTLFPKDDFGEMPGYREIELERLSSNQTGDLAQALLGHSTPPPGLIETIQQRTEGNPFYVEELLISLMESKALVRENGDWRLAGALSELQVPSTVQGVIAARVDRLDRRHRRVLQEASVIGRSFLHQVLGRISELSEELDECLSGLEDSDFIRALAQEPDLEYIFKHPLTQEVVYNSLLKSERRTVHEAIAQVIEDLLQARLPEFYETLAFHYEQGLSTRKAVEYLIKSGEKAMERFALDESHGYYRKAYDLVQSKKDRSEDEQNLLFDLLEQWCPAYYYTGNFAGMVELLRRHEADAEALRDRARRGMYHGWLGIGLMYQQRMRESYDVLHRAVKEGEEAGDTRVIAYASAWLAYTCASAYLGFPTFDEGLAAANRALDLSKSIRNDTIIYHQSLFGAAQNFMWRGEARQSHEFGNEMVEYGRRTQNPRAVYMGYWVVSFAAGNAGDHRVAVDASQKALEAAKDPFGHQICRMLRGVSAAMSNVPEDIDENLLSELHGSTWLYNRYLPFVGLKMIMEGNMNAGLRKIDEGYRESLAVDDQSTVVGSQMLRLAFYVNFIMGDPAPPLKVILKNIGFIIRHAPFADRNARRIGAEVVDGWKAMGAYGVQAQSLLWLARLHKAKKRKAKAIACLEEAEPLFVKAGAEVFLQQTRDLLAELR